jgi:hypothetical protein
MLRTVFSALEDERQRHDRQRKACIDAPELSSIQNPSHFLLPGLESVRSSPKKYLFATIPGDASARIVPPVDYALQRTS